MKRFGRSGVCLVVASLGGLVLVSGCATTSTETAQRDTLTANVGVYTPAPAGIAKMRAGVPLMDIQTSEGNERLLETLASDQLNTLMFQTERFIMVERTQIDKVLGEQNLEGIVRPDQLAKAGQMTGAQLLLMGKVTNLRIKSESADKALSLGGVPVPVLNTFGFNKGETKLVAECGVDLRLVDSTKGEVVAAHFGEFKRIDTVGAFGMRGLGISGSADASMSITDDDRGKILRLALDEALRKMLPKIDAYLVSQAAPAVAPAATAVATPAPAPAPAGEAKKFCGECGKDMAGSAKFCPSCGAKAE